MGGGFGRPSDWKTKYVKGDTGASGLVAEPAGSFGRKGMRTAQELATARRNSELTYQQQLTGADAQMTGGRWDENAAATIGAAWKDRERNSAPPLPDTTDAYYKAMARLSTDRAMRRTRGTLGGGTRGLI